MSPVLSVESTVIIKSIITKEINKYCHSCHIYKTILFIVTKFFGP